MVTGRRAFERKPARGEDTAARAEGGTVGPLPVSRAPAGITPGMRGNGPGCPGSERGAAVTRPKTGSERRAGDQTVQGGMLGSPDKAEGAQGPKEAAGPCSEQVRQCAARLEENGLALRVRPHQGKAAEARELWPAPAPVSSSGKERGSSLGRR